MSRYLPSDHAELVDALRACLGLAPLYKQKRSSEWWEAGLLAELQQRDGKTPTSTKIGG